MIDDVSLSELIQQQIQSAVKAKIDQLANDDVLLSQLESHTVDIIQQRIVGKFANIESVPDLIRTVEHSVEQLFAQGRIPDLANFVDIKTIEITMDNAIQDLVKNTIDSLVVDPAWIAKIENIVNLNMSDKLSRALSQFDMNKLIREQIDSGIERWQDRLRDNFSTHGINDRATELQLTVLDGVVVAEHELASKHLMVDSDAAVGGTLTVNNLILKGRINTDNQSWIELSQSITKKVIESVTDQWTESLVESVFDKTRTSGIEFESVTVNGSPLVAGNQLSNSITETNIQKTGTLRDLTVTGPVKLANTATVTNRRVGINTESPEMALSIWDEEVAVVLGKQAEKTAYIGTARAHDLVIGVNRRAAITVDVEGLTTVKQLRVDRFRLSHAAEVPGYSGTRGDLVFNSDPKPNSPFAWVCLGAFKWQALRSA